MDMPIVGTRLAAKQVDRVIDGFVVETGNGWFVLQTPTGDHYVLTATAEPVPPSMVPR